ncbi:MAG: hypothetical protein ACOX6E_10215 [Syntrophomonadaceae bacterium]|jgi:hypothetical protein
MNWRRVIYVTIMIFIIVIIFQNVPEATSVSSPKLLTKEIVLNHFQQRQHPVYEDNCYQPCFMHFPYDYNGDRGDNFYITMINDDGFVTIKYTIQKSSTGELDYQQKNRWPDVNLPTERFETYRYENENWSKIN